MTLIAAFVAIIFVGDLVAVGIAEIVERYSEQISLIVFLTLFAGIIPLAWHYAVRFTEPKEPAAQPPK